MRVSDLKEGIPLVSFKARDITNSVSTGEGYVETGSSVQYGAHALGGGFFQRNAPFAVLEVPNASAGMRIRVSSDTDPNLMATMISGGSGSMSLTESGTARVTQSSAFRAIGPLATVVASRRTSAERKASQQGVCEFIVGEALGAPTRTVTGGSITGLGSGISYGEWQYFTAQVGTPAIGLILESIRQRKGSYLSADPGDMEVVMRDAMAALIPPSYYWFGINGRYGNITRPAANVAFSGNGAANWAGGNYSTLNTACTVSGVIPATGPLAGLTHSGGSVIIVVGGVNSVDNIQLMKGG